MKGNEISAHARGRPHRGTGHNCTAEREKREGESGGGGICPTARARVFL